MDLENTLVIIPALNESATIGNVVTALRSQGLSRIRVVDNGSQDKTASVATQAGAEVLYEPIKGYGQACWKGLQAVSSDIGQSTGDRIGTAAAQSGTKFWQLVLRSADCLGMGPSLS